MESIIHNLFHMVDEWADQQYIIDPATKDLLARQDALQEQIILRLGDDGREVIETLIDLNLKLETIHDEALFRAAMRLGAQIAAPGPEAFHVKQSFYSTSL